MLPDGRRSRPGISGVIEVAARPSPVGVDLVHTAVVVIDMQNDFAAPGGMFDRAGIDLGWRTFSW